MQKYTGCSSSLIYILYAIVKFSLLDTCSNFFMMDYNDKLIFCLSLEKFKYFWNGLNFNKNWTGLDK